MTNNINLYSLEYPLFNLINNQICECDHLKDEHLDNKICYGLDFNGSIWIACNCKNLKPKGLNINLYSEMEINPNV
jgi:hypothetical protein